jgi:hypothetical protein
LVGEAVASAAGDPVQALGGDLIQIGIDLANLRQAVRNHGVGGAEWNQLSNYQADFQQLAQMTCS